METGDLPDFLRSIDAATLLPPVRRMIGDNDADICAWSARRLNRGGSMVTSGVWLFTGECRSQSRIAPWSLVLKVLREPVASSSVEPAAGHAVSHWNYWKREALVYRSDLLEQLPPGLTAPACFGVEERGTSRVWIWLEEIAGVDAAWSLDRYAFAANRLGRLGGALVQQRSPNHDAWLSHRLLHQWSAAYSSVAAADEVLPRRLQLEPLLAMLDEAPQTLCHRDAAPKNLAVRTHGEREDELVLLDWALAGMGGLGEDLGPLVISAVSDLPEIEPNQISTALFASYLSGLNDVGWSGEPEVVRRGYLAAAILRAELWMAWQRASMMAHGVPRDQVLNRQDRSVCLVSHLTEQLTDHHG